MPFRFVLLICFVVSLLIGCVPSNNNLSQGIIDFRVQNYHAAFLRLLSEAEKGQPDAQYAIGYMYYYGQGVVEDREQAWHWINCAAKAGQPDAVQAVKILTKPV